MARGHQKALAQQKNAAKKAKQKKKNDGKSQAEIKHSCHICKTPCTGVKVYRDHFVAKHPKEPLPEELKDL
eukprot:CAMPEP_0119131098 /NCGR_PEP_ID=MMETSP1310-20130426/9431_1 /TAXON_ID=464262 /ORGANISM="Genus nov. species nov., Strain RCC2339" /LENGTH=70 /DNA_ID=CAMNT_0007121651 /DNA_START=56 /DNA_END=268 /DNA_ORIENTATION=-